MNPFTQAILARLNDRSLREFVDRWDELEALVVRVYKRGAAQRRDETEYRRLRNWLVNAYPAWQASLESHWRKVKIGGEPALEDPFLMLLRVPSAGDFAASWRMMQTLPAAREALNEFLAWSLQIRSEP
jgi:hypothetical protein